MMSELFLILTSGFIFAIAGFYAGRYHERETKSRRVLIVECAKAYARGVRHGGSFFVDVISKYDPDKMGIRPLSEEELRSASTEVARVG